MSLASMLEADQPLLRLALKQLEDHTNKKGVDVRLTADILHKAHAKMRELGLDPADTTPQELHRALENRVARDNERLARIIGAANDYDVQHVLEPMARAAREAKLNKMAWGLKHEVAKDLLREMPPKKMMDHLGYDDIDTMLEKEPFAELYSALRFSEGGDWLNEYNELFKKVKPSDFEEREIEIIIMDHDKWVDLTEKFVIKKRHNITHTKELATIVMVPMKQIRMRGLMLKSLPLLFHYINEIRLYSSFFKLIKDKKNFGETVVDTLIADVPKVSVMDGQYVHWRVIQRYYGKIKDESHPEAFEPHVHPEDLHWRKAEESLYELDPEMEFWKDLDYVAMEYPEVGTVAFNLFDVSFAYSNGESFENRYTYHFRESLWNEIFIRYMGEATLEERILMRLDNELIAPEEIKLGKE